MSIIMSLWDSTTPFHTNDVVVHNGSIFLAAADNTNEEPSTTTATNATVTVGAGVSSGSATADGNTYTLHASGTTSVNGIVVTIQSGSGMAWAFPQRSGYNSNLNLSTNQWLQYPGSAPAYQTNHAYSHGDVIVDSNGNLQVFAYGSGNSGSSAPSWATSLGASTTDASITWACAGAAPSTGHIVILGCVINSGSLIPYQSFIDAFTPSGNNDGLTVYGNPQPTTPDTGDLFFDSAVNGNTGFSYVPDTVSSSGDTFSGGAAAPSPDWQLIVLGNSF